MKIHGKYEAWAKAVVAGSVIANANNIGFRVNCEIHEATPACKLVDPEPLHDHHEGPSHYFGTGTATHTGPRPTPHTGSGSLVGEAAIIEGSDTITASGSVG